MNHPRRKEQESSSPHYHYAPVRARTDVFRNVVAGAQRSSWRTVRGEGASSIALRIHR